MGISTASAPTGAPIPGDDGLTPLDAMLATMRWAHVAAEAACAQMAGTDAIDAAKAALALRGFVLKAAKTAAPYVHPRLRAIEPRRPGEQTYEESLEQLWRAEEEERA